MPNVFYDIETYPNVFTCAMRLDGRRTCFEISDRRNDYAALIDCLNKFQAGRFLMVGFNNIGFDYPVLHHILTSRIQLTPYQIYHKANSIIKSVDKFAHLVPPWEILIPQMDLYKIHHFDNKAKATSLKAIEINMRLENVSDLPFEPGKSLICDEIETLIAYNHDDVDATERFYRESLDKIEFRTKLSEKYNYDFTNHNDAKIGKDYIILRLGKEFCYRRTENGRKPIQTPRSSIALKDAIFPYVRFERGEFRHIQNYMSSVTITETKGAFNALTYPQMDSMVTLANDVLGYLKIESVDERNKQIDDFSVSLDYLIRPTFVEGMRYALRNFEPFDRTDENILQKAHYKFDKIGMKKLYADLDGFTFNFGTGGIHGSVKRKSYRSTPDRVIYDIDVASYYPSLAIANRIYPEHLGESFVPLYASVKEERFSHRKGTPENSTLKLALNAVFGDSNNPYSPLYDPLYTMKITINGQLLLCMLAEQLVKVPTLELIQANTDGITVFVDRQWLPAVKEICRWWEQYTLLELEDAEYSRMWIRDVNSYIAEFAESGKLKRKGAYEYELEWHKNQSSLVVQRAVEARLTRRIDIEDFIINHRDPFDFMIRAKVPRTSRLMWGDTEVQKTSRYFISRDGEPLVKIMPPLAKKPGVERHIGQSVGWKTTVCNRASDFNFDEIEYDYYIKEAEKLVV